MRRILHFLYLLSFGSSLSRRTNFSRHSLGIKANNWLKTGTNWIIRKQHQEVAILLFIQDIYPFLIGLNPRLILHKQLQSRTKSVKNFAQRIWYLSDRSPNPPWYILLSWAQKWSSRTSPLFFFFWGEGEIFNHHCFKELCLGNVQFS